MYKYRAKCVKVYDGDTITVDIELGFGVKLENQKIRLLYIDAPEIRGEERTAGLAVRDYVRERILGKTIFIETFKDRKGKYGRWLGLISYQEEGADKLRELNDELLLLPEVKVYK